MKPETEVWQVMTQGEIFQAELSTLKQWIAEGLVMPGDMVKKGNLKWIEAGRAPALRAIFAGEEVIEIPALGSSPSIVPEEPRAAPSAFEKVGSSVQTATTAQAKVPEAISPPRDPGPCNPQHHPQYVCRICSSTFCRDCIKYAESTRIEICSVCGDLCKPFEEVRTAYAHYAFQASGFGIEDFRRALVYPFKNPISLLFGAGLYGVLLLAGYRGQILAYAVLFGCLSLVINRVAYGKLDRDFMPDFSAFSPWDDLFVPLRLGVGVTAITMGPLILTILALLFGWFGGTKPPATPDAGDAMTQNQPVQVSSESKPAQPGRPGPLTTQDMNDLVNGGGPEKEEEIRRKVQAMTPSGQLARQMEESARAPSIAERVWSQLVARPGLIAILLLVSIAWAVFYYPMAIAVAGYTEDFWAVVNPFVGLDTIRRMGSVYGKAFIMYIVVQIAGVVISIPVAIVTHPFSLPFVGNLPATVIDGMVTFYVNLVIACILGLAIFKSADRLGIDVR